MDKEFKNIIRQKSNDFNVAPDTDSWSDIELQLNALDKAGKKSHSTGIARYIAAATIAALLVAGGLIWYNTNKNKPCAIIADYNKPIVIDSTDTNTEKTITLIPDEKSDQINIVGKAGSNPSPRLNNNQSPTITVRKNSNITLVEPEDKEALPKKIEIESNIAENVSTSPTVDNDTLKKGYEPSNIENTFQFLKKDKNDKMAIGLLFASNTSGSSDYQTKALSVNYNSKSFKASVLSVKQEMLEYYAVADNYDAHHSLPLSFGLSVQKNINHRFAIKSGIVYTYLHSSFKSNQVKKREQELHYIGIPLSGVATIKNFGRFSIYASAGGMVEKNIVGDLKMLHKGDETNKNNIRTNRLQWSVNAHAGLSYRFFKSLSIYIEPGWSYYFDDKSGLISYRTSHQSTFNFQAGFRFGL